MGDTFYKLVVFVGRFPFWVTSRPMVLHADRIPHGGPFILASNHLGFADVPLLMRSTPRPLDFVSIVEFFRSPLVAWLYGRMNAFPLDRGRPDPAAVRTILDRLSRGRVIAMFPEGRIRAERDSVIHGGAMRPGVGRIAQLARAPVVPVVVLGSAAYNRVASWLPLRLVRYGVIYGDPIPPVDDPEVVEQRLAEAYQQLHRELRCAMDQAAPRASGGGTSGFRAVYSEKMPSSR